MSTKHLWNEKKRRKKTITFFFSSLFMCFCYFLWPNFIGWATHSICFIFPHSIRFTVYGTAIHYECAMFVCVCLCSRYLCFNTLVYFHSFIRSIKCWFNSFTRTEKILPSAWHDVRDINYHLVMVMQFSFTILCPEKKTPINYVCDNSFSLLLLWL